MTIYGRLQPAAEGVEVEEEVAEAVWLMMSRDCRWVGAEEVEVVEEVVEMVEKGETPGVEVVEMVEKEETPVVVAAVKEKMRLT